MRTNQRSRRLKCRCIDDGCDLVRNLLVDKRCRSCLAWELDFRRQLLVVSKDMRLVAGAQADSMRCIVLGQGLRFPLLQV